MKKSKLKKKLKKLKWKQKVMMTIIQNHADLLRYMMTDCILDGTQDSGSIYMAEPIDDK